MKFMIEEIKKNTIWKMAVITIVIVLSLLIYPFGVFRHYASYQYDESAQRFYSEPVTMEEIVLQQFIPSHSVIDKIDMEAVASDVAADGTDRLFATVYDDQFNIVYQEVLDFKDVMLDRGCIEICPEMNFTVGATYYIGINVHFDSTHELRVAYKQMDEKDAAQMGYLFYAGNWIPETCACMNIYYEQPLSAVETVVSIVLVLILGIVVYILGIKVIRFAEDKNQARKILAISFGAVGSCIVGAAFYYSCILKIFSFVRLDVLFYAASCAMLEALLIYSCIRYSKFRGKSPLLREKSWIAYLKLALLVLTLWGCIRYIDNDGQWIQDQGRNLVIIFLGLYVLLSLPGTNPVRKKYNWIYLVLSIPAGVVYAVLTGQAEHALANQLLLMAGFVIWGLNILNTITYYFGANRLDRLKANGKDIFKRISPILAVSGMVLAISMLIFSYGKIWSYMMVIMLATFFVQDYSREERREHVNRCGNAVLIHFGIMALLCVLFRPIWAYRFVRYPMWFYTVACTGMYLVLVEAVAITKLFMKMKKTQTVFRDCVYEWVLNGLVWGFLFLSIARTALTAMLFMILVVLVGTILVFRPRIRQYMKTIPAILLTGLLSVVLVYSLVRCVPSVIALPYQIGSYENDISEPRIGEKANSRFYLNAENMLRSFGDRFGISIPIPESLLETGMDELGGNESEEQTMLVLSGYDEQPEDMSNGRLDVYKEYLQHIHFYGHESMNEDGDYQMGQAHAHNSFLQVAFDYGILAGISLVVICLAIVIICVVRIIRNQDRSPAIWLSLLITVGFIGASLTELVYNINIPLCLGLCFAMMYVLRKPDDCGKINS